MASPNYPLFTPHQAAGRALFKLYSSLFAAGIFSVLYYRLTHIPADHRILWLLLSLAELWFAVMWLFQQSFRWNPTDHVTHPERLPPNLPPVDVMVCTADPDKEPPALVANTLLSLMAYDYDVSKLAFYLSDDGGSELTFHAAYQASIFARHWLPFCRKYNVEPRAPQAFFFSSENSVADTGSGTFRQDYNLVKIDLHGLNSYNGPPYCGTSAIHRRESLNGRKFTPDFQPKWDEKPVCGENEDWSELEAKARTVTSCTSELGKPWGKDMGLLYGCPVEDVYTGLALHSRGWLSVYLTPERKAFLGLVPQNTNDTLIQYKRWSSGLLQVFFSHLCPFTHGIGRLKWGQIMCYTFYTFWAPWSLPILCYALLPPLAMVNGISLFPKVSDPWFKVFAFLGIASHAYSLGELLWVKGTVKTLADPGF